MRVVIFACIFLISLIGSAQPNKSAYKNDEYLKYRMHYGIINAGYASVQINEINDEGKPAFHVIGKGWTVGMIKFFFEVKDNYQTKFYQDSQLPYHFRRRVNEGGYIISRDVYFDQLNGEAFVEDHKKNKTKMLEIGEVQDMISSFYYLRNHDLSSMEKGDEIQLDMFFDYETFDFRLKYLGVDEINTKFGKIKCLKFRPLVQSGRVFKEDESLTVWITADKNKIPIRIKAELAVGSLKADLDEFKGLAHPFKIIVDN
ncbi:DUF3108 domain-containing protein [Urechidicola sp. KH5]